MEKTFNLQNLRLGSGTSARLVAMPVIRYGMWCMSRLVNREPMPSP
jgi:hypothetical protein